MTGRAQVHRLEPHDALFAAVVIQAIADYHQHIRSEYEAAQAFLASLGLLGDAGEVRATDDLALMLGGGDVTFDQNR